MVPALTGRKRPASPPPAGKLAVWLRRAGAGARTTGAARRRACHPCPTRTRPSKKITEDPASAETLVPQDCPDLPQKTDLPRKPGRSGPHHARLDQARDKSRITIPSSRRITTKTAADPGSALDPACPRTPDPPPGPDPPRKSRSGTGNGPPLRQPRRARPAGPQGPRP